MHLKHSSQSFCLYTKHLSEDSRRSQHADLLNLCHSSCLCVSDTFLMFSTIPFFTVPSAPTTTGITTVFICYILCISSSKSLYLLFFSISFSAMFLSDGTVILISLQVEFTESLTMMSGLFAVIVLSVLNGMTHMMVMLLSLLCITVSGWCWYHFVCRLNIMIFTDAPMKICCSIIVPGDVLCFG